MAPFKQDSRSTTIVNPPISAPRRLNSQAERRVKLPSAFAIPPKKRGLPDDCIPNIDRVRQRTDSVSSTTSTIIASRPQSKIQSIIISTLRRHSSEETRPPTSVSGKHKAARQRTLSTKSVVEFPKVVSSQSSIPVRSPTVATNNQRKRLLSRNDEDEAQPRVRQRLHSAASTTGMQECASFRGSNQDGKPDQERRRLESLSRLSDILDPGRGGPAKEVMSITDMKRSVSLKSQSSIASLRSLELKDDSRIRKPFARTQAPSTQDISNSHSLNLDSVVDEILSNDTATLAYRHSDETMCLEDLEEIPDLPLSRPSSVARQNTAKLNLDRFDVKILSNRNTEVWDTVENGVYAWEGSLCVTDNMVKAVWASTPPVDCVNLECRAREPPSSPSSLFSSTSSPSDYTATYQGQSLYEEEVLKSMDYTKGITVNKKWERQYSYQEPNKVVWKLKFWVPIPMSLFYKLEERQFKLRAKLTFRDPSAGGLKVVAHSGSVDMSISSLKTSKFVRSS